MRRRPGIAGLQNAAATRDQFRLVGENVAKVRTDVMKEQLATFRSQLEEFARKHKVLGSGFEVISVGRRKLVRSVPTELNKDHSGILGLAQTEGYVTVEQVEKGFSWSTGRAINALETLLKVALMHPAGRASLVKAVLTAIPIHHLIAVQCPKWVYKAIDKIRRGFMWKGCRNVQGGHCLVGWQRVCRAPDLGGLGIHNLEVLGWALNMRWLWLRKAQPNRPWAEFDIQQVVQNITDEARLWCMAGAKGLRALWP
ncbi:hypothetical protein PR202_ga16412 [Eleusine coracana subsp. coracana]|uniref:Uncharacterized protein n=1 Tax=Eleusine coracana subsp. coracana TaxID=191504 RepID=A0AAV5CLL5_ELECO|nr:hypothetical protein PR202_ga16412 [Eleusine coracana subsp. coracana]